MGMRTMEIGEGNVPENLEFTNSKPRKRSVSKRAHVAAIVAICENLG